MQETYLCLLWTERKIIMYLIWTLETDLDYLYFRNLTEICKKMRKFEILIFFLSLIETIQSLRECVYMYG